MLMSGHPLFNKLLAKEPAAALLLPGQDGDPLC